MKNKLIAILIVGVILRLILSATTFHYDVRAFDFGRWVIQQGNVLNFYDYLGQLPTDNPILASYPADYFIYPPLIYGYQALWGIPLSAGFGQQFQADFLFNVSQALNNPQIYGHLLLLKIPYLVFDLLAGWYLAKLFDKPRDRVLAFGLWVFNPVNLYTTYMMGQFDVIPTFLVILSVWLAKQQKWAWAAFCLGVGASFKIYPLFLVVPLITMLPQFWTRVRLAGVALVGYLLPVLPFIWSDGFRSSALVAGQTLKSFYAQLPISGGEAIVLYLGIMVLIYYAFWYAKNGWPLWLKYLTVLMVFFSLTHFHPQWFLWVTPWVILAMIVNRLRNWLIVTVLLLAYLAQILLFEGGLNVGLFSPLNPSLLEVNSIWQLWGINLDINLMRSIAQTLLVASAIFLVYHAQRGSEE